MLHTYTTKTRRFALACSILATCLAGTAQAQMWTAIPALDTKADVITQRADDPIYSRMAVDKKYREFAQYAINVKGEQLGYQLLLESRAALFTQKDLRQVYATRAGNFHVSYWVREAPNFRTMPFKRNAVLAFIVVDTVPAKQDDAQFKAVADKLPYVVYQIKWEQPNSNHVATIRIDDSGSAVKWDCKTKEGVAMPTMLQPVIIHKPKNKDEQEYYRTGYYIADDGSLKNNGSGRRNICNKRSVGPEDEVSKWERFWG
ncbi:hypothetical protein [Undibacterium pigrum]|uniref:Uncharacterized protein n=1 Tax=Undibacterium pigrum TaxID=401470 RepID=A0A318J2L3_9BURK|nr:hypothetical protein [Undibacterium pigrum]PXX41373.1 hypothetical protein DFR42_10724 [Undibacterium pigrum]